MEKPEINIKEFVMTGFKERDFAALSSSTDIPVINERYEGKRGNTQGDKKENAPAVNATRRLTESCTELSSMDYSNIALRQSFLASIEPTASLLANLYGS